MMRVKVIVTFVLGVALSLTGCAALTAGEPRLANTSWLVTEISGQPTASDHQPTITFSDAQISGSAGCNSYAGGYTQTGGGLSISPIAMTQLACADPAVATQESGFTAALAVVAKVSGDASTAQLHDASGRTVLGLATAPAASPVPARPLVGTTWKLVTVRKDKAAATVPAGASVSLRINEGAATYSGRACNTFGGTIKIDGTQIRFAAPHSTKMGCRTADLSTLESTVLGMLSSIESFSIAGSTLSLNTADGSGLDFVAP